MGWGFETGAVVRVDVERYIYVCMLGEGAYTGCNVPLYVRVCAFAG